MSDRKKTLVFDFDGVIHSYSSAYTVAEEIKDEPVPGAFEFLNKCLDSGKFKVVIYSSRSKVQSGIAAMRLWFKRRGFERVEELEFASQKPAAWLTIDDRCFHFKGTFPSIEEIDAFKPWNKQ